MIDSSDLNRLPSESRRRFLSQAAASLLGVSTFGFSARESAGKTPPEKDTIPLRKQPAKRVISLFMGGGMSQLETFSPRPDARVEIRGEGLAIPTSADGVQVGHWLSKTAKLMNHAVAFRAMSSNQGAHAEGVYFMKTNWRKLGTTRHPHLGSWVNRLGGAINPELPGFVSVSNSAAQIDAGYLGAEFEPLVVRDPEVGLANARLRKGDTIRAMNRRLSLTQRIDAQFRDAYAGAPVKAHAKMFEATTKLMQSQDLDAFDISREPKDRRALYGNNRFGQGCLLARRLSASGVRFVEVDMGGWDTHTDHFERAGSLIKNLDRGLSALLSDLAATGELDETLVTVTSEFGRTPQINRNQGRDHYPQAFSALMAGGGIQGGQAIGDVDRDGVEITDGRVDVTQFNATIGWALGLPVDKEIFSPSRRPFTLANDGLPLTHLFEGGATS